MDHKDALIDLIQLELIEVLLTRLQAAVNIYSGFNPPPGGIIVVTRTECGEIVAVTRQTEEGQILETIWEQN